MDFIRQVSKRPGDIDVQDLSDIKIIEELYKQLWKSNKIIKDIQSLINSSWGTKDQTDHNMEILNPLYNEAKARKWI